MRRLDHEDRMQGMAYAYQQIKANGLEAFADELKMRKRDGITILIKRKEVEKLRDRIIDQASKVLTVFAVNVLYDEFDFNDKQIEQFMKRYNLKAASLAREDITWDEQISILEQEMDIHINFGD